MKTIKTPSIWDYEINKKDLRDEKVLLWYLERKATFGDWKNINKKLLLNNVDKMNISKYKKQAIKFYFSNE